MLRTLMAPLTALAVGFSAAVAPAVTHTWLGLSSSMNNAPNWSGGVPTSGDPNLTLIFPTGVSYNSLTQDIASPLSVQSLQFASGFSYGTNGNAYQFNNLGAAPPSPSETAPIWG